MKKKYIKKRLVVNFLLGVAFGFFIKDISFHASLLVFIDLIALMLILAAIRRINLGE